MRMSDYAWEDDPKRLAFTLARYKFVAKMLSGYGKVLEVGCADGFGSRIVKQHVGDLVAIDKDKGAISGCILHYKWPVSFRVHDILSYPMDGFDAVYLLDVFEHIEDENTLCKNLAATAPVCIIGTPSKESQKYASKLSLDGHVNCKSQADLKMLMKNYWRHVFMFGMNDETLHTGFGPMCHYNFAIGVNGTVP